MSNVEKVSEFLDQAKVFYCSLPRKTQKIDKQNTKKSTKSKEKAS